MSETCCGRSPNVSLPCVFFGEVGQDAFQRADACDTCGECVIECRDGHLITNSRDGPTATSICSRVAQVHSSTSHQDQPARRWRFRQCRQHSFGDGHGIDASPKGQLQLRVFQNVDFPNRSRAPVCVWCLTQQEKRNLRTRPRQNPKGRHQRKVRWSAGNLRHAGFAFYKASRKGQEQSECGHVLSVFCLRRGLHATRQPAGEE